jgi:hypothetical protein
LHATCLYWIIRILLAMGSAYLFILTYLEPVRTD